MRCQGRLGGRIFWKNRQDLRGCGFPVEAEATESYSLVMPLELRNTWDKQGRAPRWTKHGPPIHGTGGAKQF